MKKLVMGIVDFREKKLPAYRSIFSKLALGQSPDTLFIACSDSRVVPNLFVSSDPGDLFVVRNVGNLIPACDDHGVSTADESEAAAIEFSILKLNITNIIVCGHSECGAMQALLSGRENVTAPHLKAWLRHGEDALLRLDPQQTTLSQSNHLSQLNVLQQIEHLKTYPIVQERLQNNQLKLHAWWFELSRADVYAYEEPLKEFIIIDEAEASRILERLEAN